MATMVTGTRPFTKKSTGKGSKGRGPNGNGAGGNGHGRQLPDFNSSANRYRIGVWVALASIVMMFTALSSAYIVRAASSSDWTPLTMPRVLWLSTTLILVSSGTIEVAKRKLRLSIRDHRQWLAITVVFGLGFVAAQLVAWRQLVRQGIYVASNPHSSFFYLLTAAHGVHLLGGLIALAYITLRRAPNAAAIAKSQAGADAVTLYWHFMDVLWLYLFVLLFFVR